MTLLELLKKLEWSATYEDGTGNRMGHSEDSYFYPCCPICRGIKGKKPDYPCYLKFGHAPGCELASAIEIYKNDGYVI